ncbi:MAG: hypothetical protein M3256_13850 [Actinomycetota bacterium]|nr:hypothetical protein [Actinomycetota bacterium]
MKRNLTIQLDEDVVQSARVLAARRATSISNLQASEIEALVRNDEADQRAASAARAHLQKGFHLGGGTPPTRVLLQ